MAVDFTYCEKQASISYLAERAGTFRQGDRLRYQKCPTSMSVEADEKMLGNGIDSPSSNFAVSLVTASEKSWISGEYGNEKERFKGVDGSS